MLTCFTHTRVTLSQVLYFCSCDNNFNCELIVCDHLADGRAFTALKKVLLMDACPDIVTNMLRWLLLISEVEEPPIVDIMAGYDLYNRLLLGIIERNNHSMREWTAKSAYNQVSSG
jgi:hypothetical protein